MKIECGVWNVRENKLHRSGMTKDQARSLLKVHYEDCLEKKETPYLRICFRSIGEWV